MAKTEEIGTLTEHRVYQRGEECPNCGTEALYSERAGGEGATVFGTARHVHAGDTVLRCDVCGEVVQSSKPGSSSKPKRASKPKRKPSAKRRRK